MRSLNRQRGVVLFLALIMLVMMTLFAVSDIVTGSLGKDLVINDFIFNAFLYLTLGCFGIASVDKYINSKKEDDEQAS